MDLESGDQCAWSSIPLLFVRRVGVPPWVDTSHRSGFCELSLRSIVVTVYATHAPLGEIRALPTCRIPAACSRVRPRWAKRSDGVAASVKAATRDRCDMMGEVDAGKAEAGVGAITRQVGVATHKRLHPFSSVRKSGAQGFAHDHR